MGFWKSIINPEDLMTVVMYHVQYLAPSNSESVFPNSKICRGALLVLPGSNICRGALLVLPDSIINRGEVTKNLGKPHIFQNV